MTTCKEAPAHPGARIETVPVVLGTLGYGGVLLSIAASLAMTLLTLSAAVA